MIHVPVPHGINPYFPDFLSLFDLCEPFLLTMKIYISCRPFFVETGTEASFLFQGGGGIGSKLLFK
jgi:hypothetical protein